MAGRAAKAEFCGRCGRSVMVGLNARFGGFEIEADPQPLTAVGEAVALMAGRATVSLAWVGDHYEIDSRDHFRIRGSPAGTNRLDVLVVHDCGLDYGGAIPNTVTKLPVLSGTVPLPDQPPF